MDKIVVYLRNSIIVPIVTGTLGILLFLNGHKMLSLWAIHIYLIVHFIPVAYQLTGTMNMSLCDNKKTIKVTLKSFWRKLFFCCDLHNRMHWRIFLTQCALLVYVCVSVIFDCVFLLDFLTGNVAFVKWKLIWKFLFIVLFVLFGAIMVASRIEDFFMYAKWNKKGKSPRRNLFREERHTANALKIIKQKRAIIDCLQKHGLCVDRQKKYFIYHSDLPQIEMVLSNDFPELFLEFSQDKRGVRLIKVFSSKKDLLMFQVYIHDLKN